MIFGAFPFLALLISVCNETKNKLKAEAAERTTRNFPCGRLTDEPSKALTKHQSQTLLNIQTGKAASIEVKTCLLGIPHTGEERHNTFVRVCLDNPTRFEEPIKRVKLLTFKQERRSRHPHLPPGQGHR